MSVQFCLALLALSSLTAASDPDCEELLKPLEDRSQVYGKWIWHAGISDNKMTMEELKLINSSWIDFTPIPDSDDMTLHWADKTNDGCHYGTLNTTFLGNYSQMIFNYNNTSHKVVGRHLVTCPNCTVWTDSTESESKQGSKKSRNIYIFTKTGALDASHFEVFKKQAACLNFPPEFHFSGSTGLCPDTRAAATDAKKEEQ
ncbi:uncharacterized protein [Pempheris klunzingeri]|uniref:uncharacterized protein n=1 Tax=Pempheris klunzingeri TaxID=3127111 RepID=UPI003980A02C